MLSLEDAIRLHDPFHPTVADCRWWFSRLNDDVFAGDLIEPVFEVRRMREKLGLHKPSLTGEPKDGIIIMHSRFQRKLVFVNVLAHEMVHQHQDQFDEPYGHGKHFVKWKPIFEDRGLKLSKLVRND